MSAEDVKKKLFKTDSGKFELRSSYLEHYADYVSEKTGIPTERVGFPQWLPPQYTGNGDLHLVTPKTVAHGEGRTANLPHAISRYQPVVGGRKEMFLEIHPATAKSKGIRNGDLVKISNDLGSIVAHARLQAGMRPDTVVLPFGFGHWAQGRWARGRETGNPGEIIPNVSEPVSNLAGYFAVTVNVEPA
jgi:anaerobic selenocysteine-containing dehydrogenase